MESCTIVTILGDKEAKLILESKFEREMKKKVSFKGDDSVLSITNNAEFFLKILWGKYMNYCQYL